MESDKFKLDGSFQIDEAGSIRGAVVAAIIDRIRSGMLVPGSSLPPERELALQFGVSRGTLREAMRVLDHAGIVEVRTRAGTFVTEAAVSKGNQLRARAALVGEESPLDIVVARRAVEPVNARYAALNCHVRDLRDLKAAVEDQRHLSDRGVNPEASDGHFHLAVARASRNPLLYALFERIASSMSQAMWIEFKNRSKDQSRRNEAYVDHHLEIVRAIEAGDSSGASRAMIDHLDFVEEGLLAQVP